MYECRNTKPGIISHIQGDCRAITEGHFGDNSKIETPVDYFRFYNSVSSIYSSKIEGEQIDFDSLFKHKFMNVRYQPDFTKKADDLYLPYEFIFKNKLSLQNLQKAHAILSANLLPPY